MSIKFKIAALNALSKSYDSSDILALSSVRTSVKAKDLKIGDIVKNYLIGGFYQVSNITKGNDCYLVELDCPRSVNGQSFTMDLFGDYIDVYAV